jgi:hypothetical protein
VTLFLEKEQKFEGYTTIPDTQVKFETIKGEEGVIGKEGPMFKTSFGLAKGETREESKMNWTLYFIQDKNGLNLATKRAWISTGKTRAKAKLASSSTQNTDSVLSVDSETGYAPKSDGASDEGSTTSISSGTGPYITCTHEGCTVCPPYEIESAAGLLVSMGWSGSNVTQTSLFET